MSRAAIVRIFPPYENSRQENCWEQGCTVLPGRSSPTSTAGACLQGNSAAPTCSRQRAQTALASVRKNPPPPRHRAVREAPHWCTVLEPRKAAPSHQWVRSRGSVQNYKLPQSFAPQCLLLTVGKNTCQLVANSRLPVHREFSVIAAAGSPPRQEQ